VGGKWVVSGKWVGAARWREWVGVDGCGCGQVWSGVVGSDVVGCGRGWRRRRRRESVDECEEVVRRMEVRSEMVRSGEKAWKVDTGVGHRQISQ
jgi:hypothetical protein